MRTRTIAHEVPAQFFVVLIAILAIMAAGRPALAEDWARKMFTETQHDFGVVPRGSKTSFEFKLKNTFKETIHIASARSSCACTAPKILKSDLKTYEEGAIIAELNTSSFVGQRSAVVTVVFDKPYYAEVQLLVKGNIRSDIVMEPGEVQFGDVDMGSTKSSDIKISYQGSTNRDWQITDVRSTNQHLSVRLNPLKDKAGRTIYTMTVNLKDTAPFGELHDEIQIVTNEKQYNTVTLPIRAAVIPPLSVAPASIELGTMKVGASASGRMILKAKTPFAIKKIDCEDDRFSFKIPDGEKTVILVPIEFKAGEKAGAFKRTVNVISTLPEDTAVEVTITGNVTE